MTQSPHSNLSSFWTFLTGKFRVTILIGIFILIWGIASFNQIPRESTPTIEIPSATITTVWPGASPGDVEKLITNKLEKEIKTLENLDTYTSSSLSGVSVIVVNFDVESDREGNLQKLREKINDAESSLPESLPADPVFREISISDTPIINMTISGDYAWSELKQFAEVLEEEFESIPKVKEVNIKGAPEDELHIIVNPNILEQKGLSIGDVIAAIRAHHRDMPLGIIDTGSEKIEVTVKSEMKNAVDFMAIPIPIANQDFVRLDSVAEIRREFASFDVETYFIGSNQKTLTLEQGELPKAEGIESKKSASSSRASDSINAPQPSILLSVIKSASKGNVIKMVEQVFDKVETLKENKTIPESLNTTITYTRANDIKQSLEILTDSGLQTLVLIAIAMLAFVGWRESFLAAIAIPLSMLIAIIVLQSLGRTFNGVSLFALVLGIGLLVDNAIVIVESMSEAINEKKMSPREASHYTLETFRWPLITGTLTTVFAFFPMIIFVTGTSGQFIRVIPITVTTVLLSALFISLWLLPNYSEMFFTIFPPKAHKESATLKKIKKWYERTMFKILSSNKKLWLTISLALCVFISSLVIVGTGQIPVEVFPGGDESYFNVDFEFPEGTSLEETKKIMPQVTAALAPYIKQNTDRTLRLSKGEQAEEIESKKSASSSRDADSNIEPQFQNTIDSLVFTPGASQAVGDGGGASQDKTSILGLTVNLVDEDDRSIASYDIVENLRPILEKSVPSFVKTDIVELRGGPPSGAAVEIRLTGNNLQRLEAFAEDIKTELESYEGLINARDSRKDRTKQLTWRFKRDQMTKFGLAPTQVMETLRSAINGVTAVRITEGDEEIDAVVRVDWIGDKSWTDPSSLEIVKNIPIKTPSGNFIKFEQIATAQLTAELSQIAHRDGERIITVSADTERGRTGSEFTPKIQKFISQLNTNPGELIQIGGDSEEGNKLIGQVIQAMLFALILIFIILVAQFNSFSQPLIVLGLIPLSLTGVFWGFFIGGKTITFPTMIGIVALAGIIVNDAIVLVDQMNRNLKKNTDKALLHEKETLQKEAESKKQLLIKAYIKAGQDRFQPIFLTSLTTVVGMIPLSLSDPFWEGLGLAIIYGMALSTILCLLLTPCFMLVNEQLKVKVQRIFRR
jgi:multidrug efflux pump subunit AcrB